MQDYKQPGGLRIDDKCPFLGLPKDVSTYSDYPSEFNHCHRAKHLSMPSFLHQRDFCLTQGYINCPLMQEKKLRHMPEFLARPQPGPGRKRNFLIAFVLFAVMLCVAVFAFGWSEGIGAAVNTLINDKIMNGSSPTALSLSYLTRTLTPTRTLTLTPTFRPTRTFTPTKTVSPTAIQTSIEYFDLTATYESALLLGSPTTTPACSYSIIYLGYTYLKTGNLQLSYLMPVDLSPFQVLDRFGQPTPELELPGFKLLKNGNPVYIYGTYLRDPKNINFLYIEMLSRPEDVIEVEFYDSTQRYCSDPFMIPANTATPTQTHTFTATLAPTNTHAAYTPTPTKTKTPVPTKTVTPTPTNSPPTIEIESPKNDDLPARAFVFLATVSDFDNDPLLIVWTYDGGSFTGNNVFYQFPDTIPANTTLTVTATVTDGKGGSDSDDVTIIVID